MKRLFLVLFLVIVQTGVSIFGAAVVYAEEPSSLYSLSAVLIDGDSGRILYEKEGHVMRPMASTTKIMTCIVALEQGNLEDEAVASSYAASRPKVKLGVQEGETFYLKDLLYSLMLESHNDAAVVIAEHIGGSVEGFAKLMNDKAKELQCEDTYFITPNGLDATQEVEVTAPDGSISTVQKTHGTTAADLARIMKYCVSNSPKKDDFLRITQTASHSFSNTKGSRSFSCNNHNAFLSMMEGAISGKTGFTGNAGYCYVGAVSRDGRLFIVALLGCGWPNNKTYKWSDTKKLMQYGIDNYTYREVWEPLEVEPIPVDDGIKDSVPAVLKVAEEEQSLSLLLRQDEQVKREVEIAKTLKAPIKPGTNIGSVKYLLNGEVLREYPIETTKGVDKIDYPWCFQKVADAFIL